MSITAQVVYVSATKKGLESDNDLLIPNVSANHLLYYLDTHLFDRYPNGKRREFITCHTRLPYGKTIHLVVLPVFTHT